jgi:hypothetical protein
MKKPITLIVLVALLTSSCSFFNDRLGNQTSDLSSTDSSRDVASIKIDQIIEEFKNHFESDLSAVRKEEVKIIQENLLKYLIEATNSEDSYKIKIYNDATTYFNKIYPVLLNNIKNEKVGKTSFDEIKRAPIWTLKEEIAFLNREVEKLPTAKVKINLLQALKMINPYYKKLTPELKSALADNKVVVEKLLGKEFNLPPSFSEIDEVMGIKGSDNERIIKLVEIVERKLKKHELSVRNIGTEIAKSGQVDMGNHQIRLVVKFMDYYFNKLPDDVIKTIMSELVTAGPKMTEETVFNIVFQNTGPGLGKVLQQMGKEKGVGDRFSALLAILESSGKQVPIHLVHDVVDADKGGFEVKSISENIYPHLILFGHELCLYCL